MMSLAVLERLRPALDAWNRGPRDARDTYRRENHCGCGEFVGFAPTHRDERFCESCARAKVASR